MSIERKTYAEHHALSRALRSLGEAERSLEDGIPVRCTGGKDSHAGGFHAVRPYRKCAGCATARAYQKMQNAMDDLNDAIEAHDVAHPELYPEEE